VKTGARTAPVFFRPAREAGSGSASLGTRDRQRDFIAAHHAFLFAVAFRIGITQVNRP
jgi:hypothetical protein